MAPLLPDWSSHWRMSVQGSPFVDNIHPVEQLDYAVRQSGWLAKVLLLNGYKYKIPYADPSWAGFLLAQTAEWRHDKKLYRAIVTRSFPGLSRLPVKESGGVPLSATRARRLAGRLRSRSQHYIGQFLGVDAWTAPYRQTNYLVESREYATNVQFKAVVDELAGDAASIPVVARVLAKSKSWPTDMGSLVRLRAASIGALLTSGASST